MLYFFSAEKKRGGGRKRAGDDDDLFEEEEELAPASRKRSKKQLEKDQGQAEAQQPQQVEQREGSVAVVVNGEFCTARRI